MRNFLVGLLLVTLCNGYSQNSWYVQNTETNGNGSVSAPFNNFNDATDALSAGDTLFVMPGNYQLSDPLSISNLRGEASQRITIKAYNSSDKPIIRNAGNIGHDRVLKVEGSRYLVFKDLIFEGAFRSDELIYLSYENNFIEINSCTIRKALGGITLREAHNVTVVGCEIYYIFRGTRNDPIDAHGINSYDSDNLTVRETNITHCTGDAIQINVILRDWDNVLIEDCEFSAQPLTEDVHIFRIGDILGENGIDTKTNAGQASRSRITIRNVKVHGYVDVPYYGRRAALNLKHEILATVTNAEVYNNEIGMRLRGAYTWDGITRSSCDVTLVNNILYDNQIGFRFENWVEDLKIYNSTLDKTGDETYISNTSSGQGADLSSLDIRNCLFFGAKPMEYNEAQDESNLAFSEDDVIDRTGRNYMLTENSIAINEGVNIEAAEEDYMGKVRLTNSYDVGAFEYDSDPIAVSAINVTGQGDATEVDQSSSLQMSAEVLPSLATNKSIVWSVEDGTGSADINSSGVLTPTGLGTITVVATATDGSGITGVCELEITDNTVAVTEINVTSDGDITEINNSSSLQMSAQVLPLQATNKSITWSVVEGTGSAEISASGVLTTTGLGTITVVASATDGSGVTGVCDMEVTDNTVLVSDISISAGEGAASLSEDGGTVQMQAEVIPANASMNDVTWSIENGTGEASITPGGVVVGISEGSVTVFATANDGSGISSSFNLNIVAAPGATTIWVEDIRIGAHNNEYTIGTIGGSLQLTADVFPSNANDTTVIWSIVAGTGEATISESGRVTATSGGSVMAQALASDGSGVIDTYGIYIYAENPSGIIDEENSKINYETSDGTITVYHNAATQEEMMVRLVDLSGKVLFSDNIVSDTRINIQQHIPGVYILQYLSNNTLESVKVFIP